MTYNIIRQAIDLILPPRCLVSGEIVDEQGMVTPEIWSQLNFITSPFCRSCGVPFEFDTDEGDGDCLGVCAECLKKQPVFTSARAALVYDDVSRDMILGFKHADKLHAAVTFANWLHHAGSEILEQADYLLPVPLHPWRLLKRRYNQAAILAHRLSQKTGVSYFPDALIRRRSTPSQGMLKPEERQRNVRNAFALRLKYSAIFQDKKLVLIDDVYTTGATVNECAKILLAAGAQDVHILTLARVVKSNAAI